ncbi:MIP/aquaporin family protein [Arthrobacter cupressi]|uniref:Aquaporin Z n=1 Tax=Arthrobacter cupressi TaxID=1045773 RepID=A0A1G8U6U7_9MICC|nr:aquaporin [Arthrobacter cupressi]NYD76561.1 aquaporin Z [Arthrobacter cupressi]SDJ49344.1 aquaporin Z [Arthrobacter cupressi]
MTSVVSASRSGSTRLLARAAAEALGTLFLVVIALGVPLFAVPQLNPLPDSLAAGLAVTAAMLAFGAVSGGHFNPAITVGTMIAGRTRFADGLAYLAAQLIGGILGAFVLFAVVLSLSNISDSRAAFDTVASGFGEHSVIKVQLAGALLVEVLGAALLVAIYLGASLGRKSAALSAPLAVGLTVAVLLQLGQSMGNLAFNPARATAAALFSTGWAAGGLWLFWVAPLMGAAIAGLVFRGFGLLPAPETAAGEAVPDEAASDDDALDGGAPEGDDNEDGPNGGAEPDGGDAPAETARRDTAARDAAQRDEARDFFDGNRD